MKPVSLVIPHFNRFDFLLECVQHVIGDPRVTEICISDDHSTDGSYEKLVEWASKDRFKVNLFRNSKNQDCYRNKFMGVCAASSNWVILFDDDNIIGKDYIDTLFALPVWDEETVYCPEFAQPHFDYRAFSGLTVTRKNVASFMPRPHFATALNTANYFFYRPNWVKVWNGALDPHTADSIYQAYRLLQGGQKLYITPGLQYFHRVHEGSHYKRNVHKTGRFAREVEIYLKDLK